MLDTPTLNSLLQAVAQAIDEANSRERAHALAEAHRFEPFAYLRKDEVGLCRIIADLLAPDGSHGQGPRFLRRFLTEIGIPFERADLERALVRTETRTDETDTRLRRIDIEIDLSDGAVVVVEAKPFAVESVDQVGNMMEHADKRARRFGLNPARAAYGVFITPNGRKPETIDRNYYDQIVKDGRFKLLRFSNRFGEDAASTSVSNWINECTKDVGANAGRLQWFLSEFSRHLDQRFGSTLGEALMNDRHDLVQTVFSKEPLERLAAFCIAENAGALRKEALCCLMRAMKDRLRKIDHRYSVELYQTERGESNLIDPESLPDPHELSHHALTLVWRNKDWPARCGLALWIEKVDEIYELGLGFIAPSSAMGSEKLNGWSRISDLSARSIFEAVHSRIQEASQALSRTYLRIWADKDWWPVCMTWSKPLGEPFTPEGFVAMADPVQVDALAECLMTMYAATRDLQIEAA